VFVIEEKQPNIEALIKDALYGLADRPVVVGKSDERGEPLVPGHGALDADILVPILRRRIEARVGESRLQIHDEVENVGQDRTPHMYLYHVNVGFPVVDEGSELLVPARSVAARGDYPVEGYSVFRGPSAGYVEQVFEHDVVAEPDGAVPVAIVNRELGLGVYELFRRDQLPHHFVWRMLGEGTYVVGIEPSTNRTAGRLDARARGELIELGPGERRVYDLELGALDGEPAIEAFEARVESALAGAPA